MAGMGFNMGSNWWDLFGLTQQEADEMDWEGFGENFADPMQMQQGYNPAARQFLPGYRYSPYQQFARKRAQMFSSGLPTMSKSTSPAQATNPAGVVVPPTNPGAEGTQNMRMTDTTSAQTENPTVTYLRKLLYGG